MISSRQGYPVDDRSSIQSQLITPEIIVNVVNTSAKQGVEIKT
jgi:hypothetical protein